MTIGHVNWDEEESNPPRSGRGETRSVTGISDVNTDELLDTFKNMTVIELSKFVEDFENTFGVTAQQPVTPPPAEHYDTVPVEVEPEPDEWTVTITGIGDKKILVIKEVRAITKLGLADAKAFVENLPLPVVENVDKMRAIQVRVALEKTGATVTMQPS